MGTKTRTYEQFLVIDWRNGNSRTRKSEPDQSELGTNDLLAELEIRVNVPEVDTPKLAMEVDVPEAQIHQAVLEAVDEEDLPDWTDVANEVIDGHMGRIKKDASSSTEEIVNAIVGETLLKANGRPKPEHVRDYVRDYVLEHRPDR